MTRKQALFIIVVNAMISTVISVAVALLIVLPTWRISPVAQIGAPSSPQAVHTAVQAAGITGAPAEGAVPTSTPIVYIVQPGDSLSGLALRFDVPAADIIVANQIPNPDFLPAGVELIIPVGGVPPTTATWTPLPTATHTPLPFEPPSAGLTATAVVEPAEALATPTSPLAAMEEPQVEITEIVGVGDLQQERVVIGNVSDRVADLEGWSLSDADENTYWFPNFRLWAQASVAVDTRVGQDGDPPLTLYWGKLQSVWSPGEVATLKNAAGEVVTVYTIR